MASPTVESFVCLYQRSPFAAHLVRLARSVQDLETALSFYVDARKPLPTPRPARRGQRTVRPSALECAKLGVYQVMAKQGLTKSELARRLGWHPPQVGRLFDLGHASRIDCSLRARLPP
jgi:antitoxin HicB